MTQRVDVAITPEATTGPPAPAVENEVSENQINSEIELLTSKDLLTEVVKQMRRAPRFARKVQAEWISMAETALRG